MGERGLRRHFSTHESGSSPPVADIRDTLPKQDFACQRADVAIARLIRIAA